MWIHRRNPLDPVGGTETPESAALSRRRWLRGAIGAAAGLALAGGTGYAGYRWYRGSDEEVLARGRADDSSPAVASFYPAPRDERFAYGRTESIEVDVARHTNFYEFSSFKSSWRLVDNFRTDPWTLTVDGLCRRPQKFDLDELLKAFASHLVERQYRHRCVETWAMAVPWTGIPLRAILEAVEPTAAATHVRFVSFNRPEEAPGMASDRFPWPYTEGLTLPEAGNELTLLATGMYGHPLFKQNGAPMRIVVPWKYGFKSIKSIERIELVDREPLPFWTDLQPLAYPFESNVDPDVPVPWPQKTETMLGTGEVRPTAIYNGYGEWVAHLYR